MHTVVVHLTITADFDTDTSQLREQVVPAVSHAPGFVAGYWTRKERSGLSVLVFESEDAAQAMSENIPSMLRSDPVTLEGVEVREVVAHA